MLNLQELLTPLIPHIKTMGDTLDQWGNAIVARLDGIHYAVLSEDFEELRQRLPVIIGPAEGRKTVAEIPVGHEWKLENWFVNLATVGPFILRVDDEPVFGKTPGAAIDSGGGNDLVVSGRATITIEAVGAAAGRVYLSFARRVPTGRPRSFAGGGAEITPAHPHAAAPPASAAHMPAYPVGKVLVR